MSKSGKTWRLANREKVNKQSRDWRKANLSKVKKVNAAWRQTPSGQESIAKARHKLENRFYQLKYSANKRGISVELTLEQYRDLVKGICYYCGRALLGNGPEIDRQDHNKGYTLDNCVPCCSHRPKEGKKSCNHIKGLLEAAGLKYPRNVQILMEILMETI